MKRYDKHPDAVSEPKPSRRGLLVAGLSTAAALLLAGCGGETAPTKSPATATASETPTPSAPETSKPLGDIIGGIDVSNLSPASRELAAKLTPEKVAAMTEEERAEAFTIKLADIDSGVGDGEEQARAYVERTFVLLASMYSAGATPADNEAFKNNPAPGYREFNQTVLLDPTISAMFGQGIAESAALREYSFAERNYGIQRYTGVLREHPDHSSLPAVKAMKDYSIVFSLDEPSIAVQVNGSGETGNPISVSYAFGFAERNGYTPEQLQAFAIVGANPAVYGDVEGKVSITITRAQENHSGGVGKIAPEGLVASMESNQNSDGTVS